MRRDKNPGIQIFIAHSGVCIIIAAEKLLPFSNKWKNSSPRGMTKRIISNGISCQSLTLAHTYSTRTTVYSIRCRIPKRRSTPIHLNYDRVELFSDEKKKDEGSVARPSVKVFQRERERESCKATWLPGGKVSSKKRGLPGEEERTEGATPHFLIFNRPLLLRSSPFFLLSRCESDSFIASAVGRKRNNQPESARGSVYSIATLARFINAAVE